MVRSALIALSLAAFLIALPYAAMAGEVVVETLLTGLTSPCGVAIRPGDSADRYEVFVADSGAGRVIRMWSNEPKSSAEVITGFVLSTFGKDGLPVGPTGLFFLDRSHLIVGASGEEGASVRMFELVEQSAPLSADLAKQHVMIVVEDGVRNHAFGVVRTLANDKVADALVLSCFTNEPSGDLRTIPVRAGTLGELQTFTTTEEASEKSTPAAIAIDGRGYIVVGWAVSSREPRHSRLAFYSPVDGSLLLKLSTDLNDILGLAYSPKTGNLYAADAAWTDAKTGGVFRIDDASQPGTPKCLAKKIADALRPSALAFGPDGALFVTAFGDVSDETPNGVLLKLTGDL